MAALKILAVATMAVAAQGMELTKSNFQEVKDSGKNAFVSGAVCSCVGWACWLFQRVRRGAGWLCCLS